MEFEVQGIFAGKWLKLTYDIDKKLLEDDYMDNDYADNLKLLKKYPEETEVISRGRLDILMRTNPDVLYELSDYRLEKDNLTLYERLIEVLLKVDKYPNIEEYINPVYSLHGIDDALMILRHKK